MIVARPLSFKSEDIDLNEHPHLKSKKRILKIILYTLIIFLLILAIIAIVYIFK
jgi:flagellar basal body-associated protein FliL